MNDNRKTKGQLIQELEDLRRRIAELEKSETERKQIEEKLLEQEQQLLLITDNIPAQVCYLDQAHCYRFVNKPYAEFYGLPKETLIGRNYKDIVGEDYYLENLQNIELAFSGQLISFETPIVFPNANKSWEMVYYVPHSDPEGNIRGVFVLRNDITERKHAEEKIKTLLKEKELLLREVHHRVKNNMITIMTLLRLQSKKLEDPNAIAALGDANSRLQSMAVLYDKLYRTEKLREMSTKDYLPALVDEVIGVFPNKESVKIETRIGDFVLGVNDLYPLGIIVNELLTNAMKHAFIGRVDGEIRVSATIKDHLATFIIEDNGNGIPESIDIETSTGFGLQLVGMMTKQIGGTIKLERGKGTRFTLEFGV
jgi:PAS domain S-box-containing protein